MKKILTAVVGVLVVVGAGAGLWIVLDSSKNAATVGKIKISEKQVKDTVAAVIAERKTVSTTGMTLAYGDSLSAEQLNYFVVSTLLSQTLAAKLKSAEVSAGIATKDFDGYIREILSIEALQAMVQKQGTAVADSGTKVQDLVRQLSIKEGVKIEPKYGTWDSTQVSVVPPATAASTSPTPAPSN